MAVPIKGRKQEARDEPPSLPSRRLAAIMFTDLVGYSAMAHRDEALAIELLELHRGWVREILPRYGGTEIETVGDAFLIVFAGALAAVECAIALQQRFAEHNKAEPARRMQLRVGIHLGDIEHRAGKVMGDGVNIASRIHAMAQPGGICVSEDVQRAVRNRAGLRFTSLGTPDLKNISTPIELFALHAGPDSLRNAVIARARRTVDRIPRWILYPVLAITMISFFSKDKDEDRVREALELSANMPVPPATPGAKRPAVMVPPFQNEGAESGAAIAEALHQATVEQLGVQGLEVMSVASAMRDPVAEFRKLADKEVGHVLVAAVTKKDQRLRVTAQLLETQNGAPVWSSEYERDLADVAAVQVDLARTIAVAVRMRLVRDD